MIRYGAIVAALTLALCGVRLESRGRAWWAHERGEYGDVPEPDFGIFWENGLVLDPYMIYDPSTGTFSLVRTPTIGLGKSLSEVAMVAFVTFLCFEGWRLTRARREAVG